MKHILITLVLCAMTCTATSAQEATDTTVREVPAIVGKQVRIWPTESIAPIDGRVASINRSGIRLDTDDVYCGISGCVRSFASNWVIWTVSKSGDSTRQSGRSALSWWRV